MSMIKKFLEKADLAPIYYSQFVGGRHEYRSAFCGCFSLAFWILLFLSLSYQISMVIGGQLSYNYNVETAQQMDITGAQSNFSFYFSVLLQNNESRSTTFISEANSHHFGIEISCQSFSNKTCDLENEAFLIWGIRKITVSKDAQKLLPSAAIIIDFCDSPECVNSLCHLDDTKYKYILVQGNIIDTYSHFFGFKYDIKNDICNQYNGGQVGIFVQKKIYQMDRSLFNVITIPYIDSFLNNASKQTHQSPELIRMTNESAYPIPRPPIVSISFSYNGRVQKQKWSHKKIDQIMPPILGLLAISSTFFYLLTGAYKNWHMRMSITLQVFEEETQCLCRPSFGLWLCSMLQPICKKLFGASCFPTRNRQLVQKLYYTQKKMKQLDFQLDIVEIYRKQNETNKKFEYLYQQIDELKELMGKKQMRNKLEEKEMKESIEDHNIQGISITSPLLSSSSII